jgi:predicted transcriptional regulator
MKKHATKLALASETLHAPSAQTNASHETLVAATSQIVSAYIANRGHEALNLNALMADVYATLSSLSQESSSQAHAGSTGGSRKPVVAIEESIKADYLVCLEDGKRVKMLKRHLKTAYNMSPEQYRARWDLPSTYPMVAPNYAKVRSQLAKQIGLGQRRGLNSVKTRMNAAAASLR